MVDKALSCLEPLGVYDSVSELLELSSASRVAGSRCFGQKASVQMVLVLARVVLARMLQCLRCRRFLLCPRVSGSRRLAEDVAVLGVGGFFCARCCWR